MPRFKATSQGNIPFTAEEEIQADIDEAAYLAELPVKQAEENRINEIKATVASDSIITQLESMTNAEYNAWFSANITNTAQAIQLLKRLTRIIIRRVL